jgi:hypothetical protein
MAVAFTLEFQLNTGDHKGIRKILEKDNRTRESYKKTKPTDEHNSCVK